MKKQSLGRGLDALLGSDDIKTYGSSSINEVPLEYIHPNESQPRRFFDEEALEELAISIKENGIITPITLRKIDENNYQIIAGERRYRASLAAGIKKIPAYIREAGDEDVMMMALIENIQREDLNAIEISLSYQKLIEMSSLTQEQLAQKVGKKRATVANYLRLLKLPAEVQMGLKDQKIEMGHARALLGLDTASAQKKVYEQIIANGYSVRKTEEIVKRYGEKPTKKSADKTLMPKEIDDLQGALSKLFNTKISLSYNAKGKGKISIPFASNDELERLMEMFDSIKKH
ncbi:MAG: ParB/RepB/Spo0J family partition protein [Bacteroidales bacterium]|nr:ParB/RepB/Spo0J family partition protein [Bacteroidales bacterium]